MDKKKTIFKILGIILLCIVLLWFALVLYNFYRAKNDNKPILCFHEIKDIESETEYSKTCYGILYKYREYYYTESNEMSAREYTLFFKEFAREVNQDETE